MGENGSRRRRTTYLLTTIAALVAGFAMGTSYFPGAGSLLANTSYVGLNGGIGGATCPIAAGWTTFPPSAPSTGEVDGGMAYDYVDGYVVYFGGYTGSTYITNTWEYSGGCWKNLGAIAGPDGRSEFGMVWDGADNEVLLFGGADSGSSSGVGCSNSNSYYFYMCGDTWEFKGGAWTNVCDNGDVGVSGTFCAHGASPPPLNAPLMAYDPVQSDCEFGNITSGVPSTGCVILMGGFRCTLNCGLSNEKDGDSNQTWEFFNGQWHQNKNGIGGAGQPGTRDSGGLAYDSTNNYLLLYGGENSSCTSGTCSYLGGSCVKEPADDYCDDAWTLKGGVWTQQCTGTDNWKQHKNGACRPPGAEGISMAYDGHESYIMLYGGFNGLISTYDSDSYGYVNGTFEWVNYGTGLGDWAALSSPPAPASRYGASLVYDPGTDDQYMVLLGGANHAGYYTNIDLYS